MAKYPEESTQYYIESVVEDAEKILRWEENHGSK